MIKTEKLTKVYSTEEIDTFALDKVSLHIKEGEFVSIMGPSGCGKSTLLNLIGLLDTPSDGSYKLFGSEISTYKENERAMLRKGNIGFIFQSFNLIDELTVYENVELPLLYMKENKSKIKSKVNDLLEKMNIAHRKNHFPQQLSGGQQQRVAVARAVVSEPRLILADEPTGNLDTGHGNEVMDILKKLNEEGKTIVMVTHSEANAKESGRIIRLLDGKIIK